MDINQALILLNNPIVWATVAVAIGCYGLLIRFCFTQIKDQLWFEQSQDWIPALRQMLTSLPLLGLLGTISGLKETFIRLADSGVVALQELITGGIGDALFTTELGLVLVVPGIVLLNLLTRQRRDWQAGRIHEILN